jgi:hypothetical protein
MSDKIEEPAGDQNLDDIRAEAKNVLEEIKKIKAQAEEQLKAAEASRRGADEHASYANQAKKNTEDHSKATASFKGTAESDQNSIATNKQKSDELLAALTRGKADSEADTKAISEQRKKVDQATEDLVKAAQISSTRLQETEKSKTAADAFLKETEEIRDAAIQARSKTDAAQTQVQQLFAQTSELSKKITDAHTKSTDLSAQINEILTAATTDEEKLKEILDKLTKSHATASEFEARVIKSSKDLDSLIERTDALLPGVTSASLASAFGQHKKRFTFPKISWIGVFLLCMGGLVYVAYPSFSAALSDKLSDKTWTDVFRGFVMRLPIVIPLVWLAIYAGRNYMLSIRLEEDYAYKEAISMSFEGYKREMEKIAAGQPAGPNNPITTLCVNVLKAIAERPGRIYEGKHKDITLHNEALGVLEQATEFSKKQISAK